MDIIKAAYAFEYDGNPISCREFGSGHINSTFIIGTDDGKSYVLQHINKYVFKSPLKVMENTGAVTNYLEQHSDGTCKTMHFLSTTAGRYCHRDEYGEYWRMYEYIPGICLNSPESDEDLYQSALAFGWFQEILTDFPAHTLHETIPHFHDTPDRYRQFEQSVQEDLAGRATDTKAEIDYLMERKELAGTLQRMLDAGELPLRVTHNDTKLNNVLLDKVTHKCVCVLDLDTVMPGLSLYDFGDAIRFGASTAAEDEQDLSKVKLDLHLFEVYTKGYLEATPSLTENEIRLLPMGALIMTLELATRFLKDYLDGDLYFKTKLPDHNLIRARNQIALAADMEKKLPQMEQIVAKLRGVEPQSSDKE